MDRYPEISEHGFIGDLQTAALVSSDGTVDWFCCPRFDSPSVFASLLDAERGGYFRIAPDTRDYVSRQLYFPDTAMLITRFMTPDGVRLLPITANRQPGVAAYLRRPGDDAFRPFAICVLRIERRKLIDIAAFEQPSLFPAFGLPPSL